MTARTAMPAETTGRPLPDIPVIETGADLASASLRVGMGAAEALLADASGPTPPAAIRLADRISRAWLRRTRNPYLAEIDEVARLLGRPGAYFFNVHYEWGCTSGVKPCPRARSARLVRVLDWHTAGLGRHIHAVRVSGNRAGDYVTMSWPGFAGVLQAMAPGRFAAALNQAPMAMPVGAMPLDWAIARWQVWRSEHLPPAHLLRRVMETAADYASARRMLEETPVAAPAIFTLSGLKAGEGAIIERREEMARLYDGAAFAANSWSAPDWQGRVRGLGNDERVAMMRGLKGGIGLDLDWLAPPVLNPTTSLAMVAEAASGRMIARGYEADGPATADLTLEG
ncbi:MAG: hypothetical protein R3D33_08890 [Hyphomicrobiaceae bacterium]